MKKKILLYENSSGFAQYTYKLCNALATQYPEFEIHYLTDPKNIYLCDINDAVIVKPILKVPAPIKGKRIKWAINRLYVAVSNILIRNRYAKENCIDLVSIQSTLSTVDQFFIGSFCKKNAVILTVHDVIPPIKSLYWSKGSLKKLYDTCKLLIVHSNNNKSQLIEQFNINDNKIIVIHHGKKESYASWSFYILNKKLKSKLKYLAIIDADYMFNNRKKYYKYTNITFYQYSSFKTFIDLVDLGIITIKLKIGIFKAGKRFGQRHDRGTAFCISIQDIDFLYRKLEGVKSN